MQTIISQKRIEAAHKAVYTMRFNKIANNLHHVKELANEIISMQYHIDDDVSRGSIIAKEINKTTWKSFCRYGSKRNATRGLVLHWIDNNGEALDCQAMYISEQYGIEIGPDELAEFIMCHHTGKQRYEPYLQLKELRAAFKNTTGFNFNIKWVKRHLLCDTYQTIAPDDKCPF